MRADRTRLVPGSGVDVDRFSPVPLPMSKGGAPTFLMIARLLREKGVHEYLAAAAVVKSRFPEARFLLVGGADPRNPSSLTAVELDALGRSQHVTWVGEVEDVRPWIGQSDVVVLPSYREGVPRSLLEGAAMGRALIATDVPGCREVVQHELTGLLVPSKDVHSLAAAMQRLIESPQLVLSLAQRARMKAVAEFSEHLVIDATLRAYDEMLAPAQEGSRA